MGTLKQLIVMLLGAPYVLISAPFIFSASAILTARFAKDAKYPTYALIFLSIIFLMLLIFGSLLVFGLGCGASCSDTPISDLAILSMILTIVACATAIKIVSNHDTTKDDKG